MDPATDVHDYNRDGAVSAADAAVVFGNLGSINRINVSAPPLVTVSLANDTGPGGIPNNDGITQSYAVAGTLRSLLPISSFLAGEAPTPPRTP